MKTLNNAADNTKGTTLTTDTKGSTLNDADLVKELLELAKGNNLVIPSKGSELDSLKNSVKYQTVESVVIANVEGMKVPLIVRSFIDDKGNYYLSTKPSNTFGNTTEGTTFDSEYFMNYLESVRDNEPTTKRSINLSDDELLTLGNARVLVTTFSNDLVKFLTTKLSVANASIPVLKESSKQVATTLNSLESIKNSFSHNAINVYKVGLNPLVQTINDQVSSGLLTQDIANTILANQSKYIYTLEVPKQTRVRSKA